MSVTAGRLSPDLLDAGVVVPTDPGLESVGLVTALDPCRVGAERLDGARVRGRTLESEGTDVAGRLPDGAGCRSVRGSTGESRSGSGREGGGRRRPVEVRRDLRRVEPSDERRLQLIRALRCEERHEDVAPEHLHELDARADRRSLERAPEERVLDEGARDCGSRRHTDAGTDADPAGVVRQVEGVGERASAVTGELVLRRLRGVAVRVVRREEPVETVREDVRERPGTDGERELRHVRAAFAAARLEHARLAVVTATASATRLGHLCDLASPAMAPTRLAARLCGARVTPAHRARELLPVPAALRPALLGCRATSRLGPLPRVRPLAAPAALRFFHHLPGDPAALVSPTGLGRHGGLTGLVPAALAAPRLGRHGGGLARLVSTALASARLGRHGAASRALCRRRLRRFASVATGASRDLCRRRRFASVATGAASRARR